MITKETYMVGLGNKFELWNEELWTTRCNQWMQEDTDVEQMSVEMEQLTL